MKKEKIKKKSWEKPSVYSLNIKKDTFGGGLNGPEGAGRTIPKKS